MRATEDIERIFEFTRPYEVMGRGATGALYGVCSSARFVSVTTVAPSPVELDAFHNGPIVLGADEYDRFQAVLAQGRRPVAAPPAARL